MSIQDLAYFFQNLFYIIRDCIFQTSFPSFHQDQDPDLKVVIIFLQYLGTVFAAMPQ